MEKAVPKVQLESALDRVDLDTLKKFAAKEGSTSRQDLCDWRNVFCRRIPSPVRIFDVEVGKVGFGLDKGGVT